MGGASSTRDTSGGTYTQVNQALDLVLGVALQMPAMQALGISLENDIAGVTGDILDIPKDEGQTQGTGNSIATDVPTAGQLMRS
jgi:hypothetical protein